LLFIYSKTIIITVSVYELFRCDRWKLMMLIIVTWRRDAKVQHVNSIWVKSKPEVAFVNKQWLVYW